MSRSFRIRLATVIQNFVSLAILPLFGVPLWIFGHQIYIWLKHGIWLPKPLGGWLYEHSMYPYFEWVGVQKIVDLVLTMPLSIAAFLFQFCIIIFLFQWSEDEIRADNKSKN